MARIKKMESGGKSALGMKSVKSGFDKNPGVTRADIIVAAKKEAKDGKSIKKAQTGTKTKVSLRSGQLKRLGRLSGKNPDKAQKVGEKMVERATRRQRGKEYLKKNAPKFIPEVPEVEAKRGIKVKKARSKAEAGGMFGGKRPSCGTPRGAERKAARQARRAVRNPKFEMGGSMKKCKGGCY